MDRADIEFVGEIVRARSGLVLNADKGYLVESRLGRSRAPTSMTRWPR